LSAHFRGRSKDDRSPVSSREAELRWRQIIALRVALDPNQSSIAKLGTVEEEADESAFWLELIIEAGLLSEGKVRPLLDEANEIVAMMASSKKTASRGAKLQIANRKSQIT
jgi:hypothetical protein